MRIVTFSLNGSIQHGVRTERGIRVHPTATSAVDLAVNAADHPAGEEIAVADVTLLAPVPRPGKVICIGLNYRAHAAEGGFEVPDYPSVFLRGPTSLGGPDAAIILPACSDKLDFEAELAVVIGKTATNVRENALDYVAGYCCFNDGTIRDYQRKTTQWTSGKNFDQTGGFSADLVTPDELPAGASGLRIQSRLNGEIMQDSNTGDLIFDVAALIVTLSEAMTLEPGDVIATGTPSGVGYARKPPVFMREGDVLEVEIERIGLLSNTVGRRA
ncbi:2-keto-4-pentenoate hydratase/2-oxohepta-3-ene-1,7-dioic acid hydratase (catechol pathway) [Duganella sp. CF517]|uniref:fumarylacetoacetate hydrolase family protein n=1 Tax=Duganella sp. CF517 TaxID=1881038 RepID=UPI0008BF762C|nr:fumarylacetoacetate hydrolase family protein [Duganella sp. CF517]SEO09636.1 2-keto-4-pentenoate hydratase/2-oxohepta-3-ene-1,7-dioic acid hydratase (catechol pathway) [Duganella sp. CF517]